MKVQNVSRIRQMDFMFYPAWVLYVAVIMMESSVFAMGNSTVELLYKLLRYLVYTLCFIKICRTKYTLSDIPFLVVFVIVFILGYYSSKNRILLFNCLILLASYKMENDKTIKMTAYTQGLILFLVIFLSQTGLLLDYVFDKGVRERHSLGFIWTTVGPITFFFFVMSYVYCKRRKIKIYQVILFELINYWLYRKTNTKMVFALTTLFLFFIFFERRNKKRFKFLSKFKIIYIVYPFLAWFLVVIVCKLYNPNINTWANINSLLSGRLRLSQEAMNFYGVHLLGNEVEWKGSDIFHTTYAPGEYNYVDSSYLQLSINYGIIFMFIVMLLFSYGIYKHIKANDYYTVVIYIFILTLTMTEPQLMKFAYNPFTLLAFGIVSRDISASKYIKSHRKNRNYIQEIIIK